MGTKSHRAKQSNSRRKEWQNLGKIVDEKEDRRPWNYFQVSCLAIIVSIVGWLLYHGYLETRINTPFSSPKVVEQSGLEVPERYWGTYRPGIYFGTQVRHPVSPLFGLMWFSAGHFQNNKIALRHWCDQGDDLTSYGWRTHDGKRFGSQMIVDKLIALRTSFVKKPGSAGYGGEWSARISVLPKGNQPRQTREVSIFYYVALNPDDSFGSLIPEDNVHDTLGVVHGSSEALGSFKLSIHPVSGTIERNSRLSTMQIAPNLLKETLVQGLKLVQEDGRNKFIALSGDVFHPDDKERVSNFVAFQITGFAPFEVDIVFESKSALVRENSLRGEILTKEIDEREVKFKEDFERTFNLKAKGFNTNQIKFAMAALSNMIGGIGYFYGVSKVQGVNNKDPVPYWKAALYTAVPSRSFFPRGFLWDEGFHNLLISKWDKEISKDILAHWFDLMNWDGWIPREQILGAEARARVPDEFVVQNMKAANPPTLLLTLHSMTKDFKEMLTDNDFEYLNRLWPRLKGWYNWFNSTQFGKVPSTYRWRGRDGKSNRELNPKTLTSGLDDYPRASHPTEDERHLDLRCWMTLAAGLMADIAILIEKDPSKYRESYNYLSDNNLLDSLHWSYLSNGYMDYGLHTFDVELKRLNPKADKVRVVNSAPTMRYVDSFGYVSFFPLFLQIIDPESVKLKKVLEDLKRTDLLWTPYGLRSLARNSPLYKERNTEHDPPYWRGAIWINMNFLAVRSLYHYSQIPGPYSELSYSIYKELRHNVIDNVINQYNRTGYIWEHYSDSTGSGEGCKPFTGWSALVVLMMGETY